jgi:hypothetical protein
MLAESGGRAMRLLVNWLTSSVVLGGALLAFAACATTSAGVPATPLPQSTTMACTGTYATEHFRIHCPARWSVTTTPSIPATLFFASPQPLTGMIVSSPAGRVTASQYGTLLHQAMRRASVANIMITTKNVAIPAGANLWTLTATGTGNRGPTNTTYQQYVTSAKGARYVAVLYAPTTAFAEGEKALLAMLATVEFH